MAEYLCLFGASEYNSKLTISIIVNTEDQSEYTCSKKPMHQKPVCNFRKVIECQLTSLHVAADVGKDCYLNLRKLDIIL